MQIRVNDRFMAYQRAAAMNPFTVSGMGVLKTPPISESYPSDTTHNQVINIFME